MKKPIMMKCPHCGKEIEIDSLLMAQFGSKFKEQAEQAVLLKVREKEKLINDLRRQLGSALRKVEQAPVELQGSVQEEEILMTLAEMYPLDIITRTKRGANGADLLHRVFIQGDIETGTIYVESKNTVVWSNDWVAKLRSDNLRVHADILVIITQALPKNVEKFTMIDNVWITDFDHYKELISVLRYLLVQVHSVETTLQNQEEKQLQLYSYFTNVQFKNTLESLFAAFHNIRSSHDDEKTRTLRLWKERELNFDKILANAIEINSSLKSVVGPGFPDIKLLEPAKKN